MTRIGPQIGLLLGLAFAVLLLPADLSAQACKPTCSHLGCPTGEFHGIGNSLGIYDRDCNAGDCQVPCDPVEEEEQLALGFGSLQQVLLGLKNAQSPEDFTRVASTYRTYLLLNAPDKMVVALSGCGEEDPLPSSMVVLTAPQIEALQGLDLRTLEEAFPPGTE